jgi:hypothetical protein
VSDPVENPEPEQGLDQRVSSLETGQQNITEKIDKLLGIVGAGHDDKATDPQQPAGGTNVAHEIRQQLDERDAAARKKAEEDGLKGTVTELQTKLSELTEQAPAPPPKRVHKIMGWV